MPVRLTVLLASAVLGALALGTASQLGFTYAGRLVALPQARRDLLTTAAKVVATHPAFNGASPPARSSARYLAYVHHVAGGLREPLPYWRLIEAEDLVLNYLHDPRTSLEQDWSPAFSPDLLPVGFDWAQGGLVVYRVAGSPAALGTGDRVLAIGGIPTRRLLGRMRRYFSGNGPWLRTLAGDFLPFGDTLRWLGLEHANAVRLDLRRPSGQTYSLAVPLVPESFVSDWSYLKGQNWFVDRFVAPQGMADTSDTFYAWRLTPDYGIFWLRRCEETQGFEVAVAAFFRAVQASGVHYVVIDLQQNPGGTSIVADAFLKHLEIRGAYRDAWSPANPREIFHGKLYVLVDGGTMSSGVDVAEQLTEEGYGELVGSPAGLASAAWGNVQMFSTPDGLLSYQVSTNFVPAVNGRLTPALMPQAALPLTVQDIQTGVNPVARWLSSLATPRVKT